MASAILVCTRSAPVISPILSTWPSGGVFFAGFLLVCTRQCGPTTNTVLLQSDTIAIHKHLMCLPTALTSSDCVREDGSQQ